MTLQPAGGGVVERPSPTGLADVIDTILDKGLVIDAYVSVSLVGIEILTVNARIVVSSVDTYLRFAEAVNRLDLTESEKEGLPELMRDMTQGQITGRAKSVTQGVLEAAAEKLRDFGGEAVGERSREAVRRRRREGG
jgi:hypothetical protein